MKLFLLEQLFNKGALDLRYPFKVLLKIPNYTRSHFVIMESFLNRVLLCML